MLARLLAVPPVWAAAATLAGERHLVDAARLRARRYREASFWHGPDLGPLLAPEHETPTHSTGYTQLDHRSPPVVRAPGCCYTAGAFSLRPTPWRSAPWGLNERRQGGSARALSAERFSPQAKPGGRPEAFRLEAELSERPLRGGLPVLHWCPFACSSDAFLKGHKGIGKNSASTLGPRLTSDGR